MPNESEKRPTAEDVLRRLRDHVLLEFLGLPLNDVNQRGHFGDRPIHIIAFRGDVADLRALIEGGADMNCQGDGDFTPLHNAVLHEQIDAVRFLLEMGADRQITNDDGMTALELARECGYSEIVKLFD